MRTRDYAAGIYDQDSAALTGWRTVQWSSHRTAELALAAARRYARQNTARTGGAYTWSAWWSGPDGIAHEVPRQEVRP